MPVFYLTQAISIYLISVPNVLACECRAVLEGLIIVIQNDLAYCLQWLMQ